MRTNIVLNDALIEKALALTGARSKREVVELALRELVAHHQQKALLQLGDRDQLIAPDYEVRAAREQMNAGTGGQHRLD